MPKIRIKLVFLGHPPHGINQEKITDWDSELFEVIGPIDSLTITTNADLDNWAFSDRNIRSLLPRNVDYDILIAVTSVPLEENYYTRRFSNNRLCITFSEIGDFLKYDNIPFENFVLRVLYAASLIYKRYDRRIPTNLDYTSFTHDETKGCLFDMNGIKSDIIYSSNKPIICDACIQTLTANRVESNVLNNINGELKKIEKPLYFRISDLIKSYPIWAIVFSSLAAIILGAIGSILANIIWERL